MKELVETTVAFVAFVSITAGFMFANAMRYM
jgi:hypothetical protein